MRDVAEVAFYERRVVRSVEAVIAVGDDDARVLRRLGGPGAGSRVHVVTNGVDAAPHQHDSMQRDTPGIAGTTDAPIVVFTGTLNYEPNMRAAVLLARTIWPRVLADIPTARLIIAGRNPSEDVEALGGLPGVMIQANVRDMNDVLASAWLAAAPMLSGSGVKNKVLEAWAAGLPVVMSPLAVNGLVLPTGHDGLVSPDPLRLAAIIVTLLRSSARRQELGRAAVDLVRSRYTWEAAAERLLRLMTTAPIRQRDPHPHH